MIYVKNHELYIKTLEGNHHVSKDDYIIQGVNGELYPCKPDIFKKTYEKVEAISTLLGNVQEEMQKRKTLMNTDKAIDEIKLLAVLFKDEDEKSKPYLALIEALRCMRLAQKNVDSMCSDRVTEAALDLAIKDLIKRNGTDESEYEGLRKDYLDEAVVKLTPLGVIKG